jgi:hypothetical protein
MDTMNPQLRLAGTGAGMKALVLGAEFDTAEPHFDNQAKAAEVAMLACQQKGKKLPTAGTPSPEFLREMLKDARTVMPTRWQPAPVGATDLRLHRVTIYQRVGDGLIFSSATNSGQSK